MTDHRKRRIKALAAKLGIGHRAAANIITKRAACSRAYHAANRTPNGPTCTECGAAIEKAEKR